MSGIRFLLQSDYKGKITPELENLIDEYHEFDRTGDYDTIIMFLILKDQPVDDKFVKSFNEDFPKIKIIFFDFHDLFDFYVNKYLTLIFFFNNKLSYHIIQDLVVYEKIYRNSKNTNRIIPIY